MFLVPCNRSWGLKLEPERKKSVGHDRRRPHRQVADGELIWQAPPLLDGGAGREVNQIQET